jgi:hypothetical protein
MRRLRLGDVRRLVEDRCRGRILPDDDAGREYLRELLLPISLGSYEAIKRPGAVNLWGPVERMFQEIERWAPWMGATEADALVDEINLMPTWERKPKAKTLGKRLNVPYGERARLQLRTIGCNDMTEAAMALMRKQKKRRRNRLRRLANGVRTRAEYLAAHKTSKEQPWIALGISRRTYYYRLKTGRCTSPRQVNLTKTELALVQREKTDTSAGKCGRVSTPTPAGLTDAYANEFLTADESAWLMTWVTESGDSARAGLA